MLFPISFQIHAIVLFLSHSYVFPTEFPTGQEIPFPRINYAEIDLASIVVYDKTAAAALEMLMSADCIVQFLHHSHMHLHCIYFHLNSDITKCLLNIKYLLQDYKNCLHAVIYVLYKIDKLWGFADMT